MKHEEYELRKTLGPWQIGLYGLGAMLGAGIYALVGRAADSLGNAIWLAERLNPATSGVEMFMVTLTAPPPPPRIPSRPSAPTVSRISSPENSVTRYAVSPARVRCRGPEPCVCEP